LISIAKGLGGCFILLSDGFLDVLCRWALAICVGFPVFTNALAESLSLRPAG
jgi:hypothetical protein